MTLTEAINTLEYYRMDKTFDPVPECVEALLLGIEAMKTVKICRKEGPNRIIALLPGETAE